MTTSRLKRRFYDPQGGTRVLLEAVPQRGRFVIRQTTDGESVEDPDALELDAALERLDALEDEQRQLGRAVSGLAFALEALNDKAARSRGRGARRLERIGDSSAVEPLIKALLRQDAATRPIALALGRLGDARALVPLRELAAKDERWIRQAGSEAVRLLGDPGALDQVRRWALARMERMGAKRVAELLRALPDEGASDEELAPLFEAVKKETYSHADVLDHLYDYGSETARAAVLHWFAETQLSAGYGQSVNSRIASTGMWRGVKSVLKRAEARRDGELLGWIAWLVERTRPNAWELGWVQVRKRHRRVYSSATRRHVLGRYRRWAHQLGLDAPGTFAAQVSRVLLRYRPQDLEPEKGAVHAGLFRALCGPLGMDWPPAEPDSWAPLHAPLWDVSARPLLDLLLGSPCEPVQRFALARLRGEGFADRAPLAELDGEELVRLLGSPLAEVVELATAELTRRFDPQAPDLALIDALLGWDVVAARELAHGWMRDSLAAWRDDPDRVAIFLLAPYADTRELALELAGQILAAAAPEFRGALLDRLLDELALPEPEPGTFAVAVRAVRLHLVAELDARTDLDDALRALQFGGSAVRELMAEVVLVTDAAAAAASSVIHPDALIDLANDELLLVRRAARHLFGGDLERYRTDPSALLNLVESDWEDTREFASEHLRALDPDRLTADDLLGLCDSNRGDVQSLGRERVLALLERLPVDELVLRLSEHPDLAMQSFAVELLLEQTTPGSVPLLRLRGFLRRVLLLVAKGRRTKRRLVAHLLTRARISEAEARVVADVIGELVHARGQWDRADALQLLAQVAVAHPRVPVPLVAEGPPCT